MCRWEVGPVTGTRKDGTPLKGVTLKSMPGPVDAKGYRLDAPNAPMDPANPPRILAVDCHPALAEEFIAGTDGCDVWEVGTGLRVWEGEGEGLGELITGDGAESCDMHVGGGRGVGGGG